MSNDYILRIAESKAKYHRNRSKMTYEEKFKVVLALQVLDSEIRKSNPTKSKNAAGRSDGCEPSPMMRSNIYGLSEQGSSRLEMDVTTPYITQGHIACV